MQETSIANWSITSAKHLLTGQAITFSATNWIVLWNFYVGYEATNRYQKFKAASSRCDQSCDGKDESSHENWTVQQARQLSGEWLTD